MKFKTLTTSFLLLLGLLTTVKAQDIQAQALQIFEANCNQCHSPEAKKPKKPFLHTKEELEKLQFDDLYTGNGNLEKSEIYYRITDEGDPMPPKEAGDMLSEEDQKIIASWIQGPTKLATSSTQPSTPTTPDSKLDTTATQYLPQFEPISPQETLKAIHGDLINIPETTRPFIRYLTLTNLYNIKTDEGNQYESPQELDTYRAGIGKLMNSLSLESKIKAPVPVDSKNTVFRIDLRDYGWHKDPQFGTKWERVSQHYPYQIGGHNTRLENKIKQETQSERPVLRADWFTFATAQAPLYNELLELPTDQANMVEALENSLGINRVQNIQNSNIMRAGFKHSGVSGGALGANRLIERHEVGNYQAPYWISYDFTAANTNRQDSFFQAPFGPPEANLPVPEEAIFDHDGGEIIFGLPNGLQGYVLATAKGETLNRAPIEVVQDTNRRDGVILNGISCIACHSQGMKTPPGTTLQTIKDEVGPQLADITDHRRLFEKLYLDVTPEELREALRKDSERFQTAVEKSYGNFTPKTGEPVSALYYRFLDPIKYHQFPTEFAENDHSILRELERSDSFPILALLKQIENKDTGAIYRQDFVREYPTIAKELGLTPETFILCAHEEFFPGGKTSVAGSIIQGNQITTSRPLPWGGTIKITYSPKIRVGELYHLEITADQPCHVRIIQRGADGSSTILLPNQFQKNTFIPANHTLLLPDPKNASQPYKIEAAGKTGPEAFDIFVSQNGFKDDPQIKIASNTIGFVPVKNKEIYNSRGAPKIEATNSKRDQFLGIASKVEEIRLPYQLLP